MNCFSPLLVNKISVSGCTVSVCSDMKNIENRKKYYSVYRGKRYCDTDINKTCIFFQAEQVGQRDSDKK